jgi:hypothetical protein
MTTALLLLSLQALLQPTTALLTNLLLLLLPAICSLVPCLSAGCLKQSSFGCLTCVTDSYHC